GAGGPCSRRMSHRSLYRLAHAPESEQALASRRRWCLLCPAHLARSSQIALVRPHLLSKFPWPSPKPPGIQIHPLHSLDLMDQKSLPVIALVPFIERLQVRIKNADDLRPFDKHMPAGVPFGEQAAHFVPIEIPFDGQRAVWFRRRQIAVGDAIGTGLAHGSPPCRWQYSHPVGLPQRRSTRTRARTQRWALTSVWRVCTLCAARSSGFLKWCSPGLAVAGVVLSDHLKRADWQGRAVEQAGVAPLEVLEEVRAKLKLLLGI